MFQWKTIFKFILMFFSLQNFTNTIFITCQFLMDVHLTNLTIYLWTSRCFDVVQPTRAPQMKTAWEELYWAARSCQKPDWQQFLLVITSPEWPLIWAAWKDDPGRSKKDRALLGLVPSDQSQNAGEFCPLEK